jgi:hypothetical protein
MRAREALDGIKAAATVNRPVESPERLRRSQVYNFIVITKLDP